MIVNRHICDALFSAAHIRPVPALRPHLERFTRLLFAVGPYQLAERTEITQTGSGLFANVKIRLQEAVRFQVFYLRQATPHAHEFAGTRVAHGDSLAGV